jgi:hypothetical protein
MPSVNLLLRKRLTINLPLRKRLITNLPLRKRLTINLPLRKRGIKGDLTLKYSISPSPS